MLFLRAPYTGPAARQAFALMSFPPLRRQLLVQVGQQSSVVVQWRAAFGMRRQKSLKGATGKQVCGRAGGVVFRPEGGVYKLKLWVST